MKKDWEIKKLGEVCEIIGGTTPSTSNKAYWNGNEKWITPAEIDVSKKYIFDSVRHISKEAVKDCSLQLQPRGTVIFTSRAPIGKVAISEMEFYCNQGFKNFICSERIFNEYLYFFLIGNVDYLNSIGKGTTFKEISKTVVSQVEIPLPPFEEQKRIVKILDEKFAQLETIKANSQTNLQNAKDLFQSQLTKTFSNTTWEKKRLGEVSTVTSSKRIFKDEYVPTGIPFYRTKEIKELSHNEPISLELFISKEKYEEIKKNFGVPQIGDVLISAVGTIGEILVIENDDPFYFKDGNIIWLKNLTSFDSDYLKYHLKSFVDELKNMTRGAAYNALTIEKLKECKIPLPPLPEQKRIVKELDTLSEKVRQLQEIYTKQIANCAELKQSLLQKAFEGEL